MNDDAAWMRPDGELGAYVSSPEPPAPAPRRTRGATAAIAAGAAVALVAGVLALATLNQAGKGTPEAAVQKLLDAVAGEDMLGALDALVPAERAVLGDRLVDIAGELGRLGILSEDLDLGHIPGGDLAFADLKLQSEAITDDVASVLITGTRMTLAVTVADLPLGSLTRPLVDGAGDAIGSPDPIEPVGTRLVAVREGGDWYVSLTHSLADFLRRDAGLGAPDYAQAVVPRGESSPEAAVRELARAAADLDVRRLVELAPPGEGAALHDHAPLFLGLAERFASAVKADGLRVTVDPLKLTVKESGDDARVTITEAVVAIDSNGGRSRFSYDGRCLRFEEEDDDDPGVLCADDPDLEGLVGRFNPLGLSVVREGGSWYVSPVRTWLDDILEGLRSTSPADMEKAIAEDGGPSVLGPLLGPLPFQYLIFLGRAANSTESVEVGSGAPCTVDLATDELICLEPAPPVRPPEIMASTIPTQPLPPPDTVP